MSNGKPNNASGSSKSTGGDDAPTETSRPLIRPLGSFRSSSSEVGSKAIGNQARMDNSSATSNQSAVKKMVFGPKIVPRKAVTQPTVKQEPGPAAATSERGRGRGRGGDRGQGRGRGRGAAHVPVEMTASGPFALGPGEASSSGRRATMRVAYGGGSWDASSGSGSAIGVPTRAPKSRLGEVGGGLKEEDAQEYSDPDEPNMQVVDLSDVKGLDWMAPETLKRVKEEKHRKSKKKETQVVKAEPDGSDPMDVDEPAAEPEKNLANALDLSDSEQEEELEDVVEDFVPRSHAQESKPDPDISQDNQLYFFQFPSPFPTFLPPPSQVQSEPDTEQIDSTETPAPSNKGDKGKGKEVETDPERKGPKSVSFAPETKPPAAPAPEPLDGIIGRLEIYKSGAVKMRLGNGIVLDVTAATQPSFLQHAVLIDSGDDKVKKSMTILGEITRRFVVAPDIDVLLEHVETADSTSSQKKTELDGKGLIPMDVDG